MTEILVLLIILVSGLSFGLVIAVYRTECRLAEEALRKLREHSQGSDE